MYSRLRPSERLIAVFKSKILREQRPCSFRLSNTNLLCPELKVHSQKSCAKPSSQLGLQWLQVLMIGLVDLGKQEHRDKLIKLIEIVTEITGIIEGRRHHTDTGYYFTTQAQDYNHILFQPVSTQALAVKANYVKHLHFM